MVKEQTLPQRGAAARGKLDITTYGYAWTETRIRELMWLGRRAAAEGSQWPETARAQWHGLVGRFMRPSKLLRAIMKEDPLFAECNSFMSGPDMCFDFDTMGKWADWLARKVEERRNVGREGAKASWRAFIGESLKRGAKELHAFVKRQEATHGESIGEGAERSGQPQAIVDGERVTWTKIWDNFQGACGAPWRVADLSMDEALPRPTVAELRRCAMKFKVTIAVGWGCFAPCWIGWVAVRRATGVHN